MTNHDRNQGYYYPSLNPEQTKNCFITHFNR